MPLRFRTLPRFPARLFATGGLKITKAGADWTVAPDFGALAPLSSISDPANSDIWVRTVSASVETFSRMTLQALLSSVVQTGAGYSFAFTFDTTTTDADPGNGKLRLNQATQNTATVAYIDLTDAGGLDLTAILDSLDDSTNTIKGNWSLSKIGDATKRLLGTSAAVTTATGYRKLAIAVTGSSAASPFSNGDSVLFSFVRAGDTSATADISQNFSLSGDISPSQITADQNDYNPTGLATASTLRLNTDASRNITGLQGGADGRIIIIHNVGSFPLILKDESASSSAGNRFALLADLPLSPDQAITLQYDSTSVRWRSLAAHSSLGKHSIPVPSSHMTSRATNGPSLGVVEMATNKNMFRTLDYDPTTQQFGQFTVPRMPKSSNEGTVSFRFVWSHSATVTNFGVAFALEAVAISDDDAGDVAFGTAVQVTDTGGTTNDIYHSAESAAITAAGSPAEGDTWMFQLKRVPADAADTLAVAARIHGIELIITTNAGTDD